MATQPTTFVGQFLARLTSETPVFFKKIVYFGIALGGIGGTIMGVQASGVALPAVLTQYAGYLVTIGIVSAAIAKSATTDPNLQAKGGSNVVVNDGIESVVVDKSPKI